jgi:RNA polymerase sigma-70 factor (ECF subfamily)
MSRHALAAAAERGLDFEAAARQLYPEVLAYLRARTRNPDLARDMAQETFLQAYRSRHAFDPSRGDARGWLIGIARNVSAGAARRSGATPHLEAVAEGAWGTGPEEDDRIPALRGCLEAVSARTREILRLVYESGLSHAEVAERLAIGLAAVKVAACRGRQALADCIRRRRP